MWKFLLSIFIIYIIILIFIHLKYRNRSVMYIGTDEFNEDANIEMSYLYLKNNRGILILKLKDEKIMIAEFTITRSIFGKIQQKGVKVWPKKIKKSTKYDKIEITDENGKELFIGDLV